MYAYAANKSTLRITKHVHSRPTHEHKKPYILKPILNSQGDMFLYANLGKKELEKL